MPSLTLSAAGAAASGAAATSATVGTGIAAGGATGIAGASSLAAASLPAITGISTASVPVAGAAAATATGAAAPSMLTGLATAAVPATVGLGANLLMQPPKPKPAPNMPDVSSIFGPRSARSPGGQLGGTFLTQGKTLGGTGGSAKTLLGS